MALVIAIELPIRMNANSDERAVVMGLAQN